MEARCFCCLFITIYCYVAEFEVSRFERSTYPPQTTTTPQTTSTPQTTTTQAPALGCEVGWLDAGSTGLGCLYFEITKRSHAAAKKYCQDRTAHLVEVLTQEQLDFIRMQLQVIEEQQGTFDWWGGATDEAQEGTWIWPEAQASVGDFIWGGNDPDGGESQDYFCFYHSYDYMGVDYPETDKSNPLICQKPYSEIEYNKRVTQIEEKTGSF